VEALCDRVTIIREGRNVETGTLSELRHLTRTSIDVHTARPATGLEELAGVHGLRVDGDRACFDVDTNELDGVVRHLTRFGIRTLSSRPPTLEELFLRHYGDELADGHRSAAGRRAR
jgi:ABC-2 type transport system ATP-binding protein